MFRRFKSPLANALNSNLFPRAQRYQCSHKYWEQGNLPPPCYLDRRFFTEPEKGPLCGCACLEKPLSHSSATVATPNSHVQSRSNITGSLAHDHSTPITPSTREHATQERPSFARHRSAESTLDNASLMKILAHHGT